MMLSARGLTKRFGGVVAVRDVDLDIAKGDIVGLIGPNGSGKTTLFNLIAGVYKPDQGEIRFEGKAITGFAPDRICHAGIARTFQLARPFHDMHVIDNVVVAVLYGNAHESSVSRATLEAERILDEVGLGQLGHAVVGGLTLAQRKRLEIARALATRPKLLLLDESMAGLNPAETTAAVALLRGLRSRYDLTLLIVEHIMDVIMGLCERVVVLNSGVKIADAHPADVANDTAVVAAYLGTRAREHAARG
jgi:branched-chain amino acid transport system ATP-binding protein